ncbi:hypothetical protein KDD30_10625 [Photobacterium sp. GJ3]|uniref:hypothetical protein n=1 Tax=Photobacterium sp. GJ3 TaxID=2829502 RepID=UPI001B8DA90F|nr:hypothetical protein [Photobacterium sp. GJ3]QUJ66615.1 hypothetical protein KDD30_10625 [Photobacterium sp. GJ3]
MKEGEYTILMICSDGQFSATRRNSRDEVVLHSSGSVKRFWSNKIFLSIENIESPDAYLLKANHPLDHRVITIHSDTMTYYSSIMKKVVTSPIEYSGNAKDL